MIQTHPLDFTAETRTRAKREYDAALRQWEANLRRGAPPLALSRLGQRQNAQEHMADALRIMAKDITISANMLQARLRRKRNRVPEDEVNHILARARHEVQVAQARIRALYALMENPPHP